MATTAIDVWCDIHGFLKSQAIMSAHQLGVFDYLEKKEGCSVTEIATALGSHRRATKQLLDFMVYLRYLGIKKNAETATDEDEEDLYFNTEVANKYLTTSSPVTLAPILNINRNITYPGSTNIFPLVSEGEKYYQKYIERKVLWESDTDLEVREEFDKFMHCQCTVWQIPAITQTFDLSNFDTACDLGGGTGYVAYALAEKYPKMQVTVFDLPHIVEAAKGKKPANASRDIQFQGGDFFVDELPKADLFILSNIIHDWTEDKVDVILSKVFKALKPGGAVILLELLLDYNELTGHLFSMVLLTLVFGQQLFPKNMTALLKKHGFVDVELKKIPKSLTDGVMARKPGNKS